jgi:hypothetical protein
MAWDWAHSPGAPAGIGPIAEIGPGGAHAGRVVGLIPALKFLGDIGGPATAAYLLHRRGQKDFNDEASPEIVGASRGRVATAGPTQPMQPLDPDGSPQEQPAYRNRTSMWDRFSHDDEDQWIEDHQNAAKENRGYYRRTMGTPGHRPFEETPFGNEPPGEPPPKKKKPDTSDIRRATP